MSCKFSFVTVFKSIDYHTDLYYNYDTTGIDTDIPDELQETDPIFVVPHDEIIEKNQKKALKSVQYIVNTIVPENYQDLFIDELLGNLNNKNMNMRALYNFKNPIKLICREDEAKKQNFAGYEDYIDAFKQRLDEKMLQMVKRQEATGKSTHEDDDDYIP